MRGKNEGREKHGERKRREQGRSRGRRGEGREARRRAKRESMIKKERINNSEYRILLLLRV